MQKEKSGELLMASEKDMEIKHVGKEELEKLMKEYEEDPNNFYEINKAEFLEDEKNPALIISTDLVSQGIKEIWQGRKLGDVGKVTADAKSAAMFVMKYLGVDVDIENGCRVSAETAIEVLEKMKNEYDFKKNCEFILEEINKNDPVFSEFLAKICVRDLKTGELRNENDRVAIVEMVSFIARMIYEQMKKDASIAIKA
jgi:hypothetical protein